MTRLEDELLGQWLPGKARQTRVSFVRTHRLQLIFRTESQTIPVSSCNRHILRPAKLNSKWAKACKHTSNPDPSGEGFQVSTG